MAAAWRYDERVRELSPPGKPYPPTIADLGEPLVSFPLKLPGPKRLGWYLFGAGALTTLYLWSECSGELSLLPLFCGLFLAVGLRLSAYVADGPGVSSLSLYEYGLVARVRAETNPRLCYYEEVIEITPTDEEHTTHLALWYQQSLPLYCRSPEQEKLLIAVITEKASNCELSTKPGTLFDFLWKR